MQKTKKYFSRFKQPLTTIPNLVESQINSFNWLIENGIGEVLKEFSPIRDYAGKKFELSFTNFKLTKPKYDEHYAKVNKLSYEGQIEVTVKLKNKTIGEEKEQEIFLADFPMMTNHGTFIINGIERVISPQLARSFGIFFTVNDVKGKNYFGAKVIPARGVWMEIETDTDGTVYARIDRKRKFPITSLMRILGADTNEKILELFKNDEKAKKVIVKS